MGRAAYKSIKEGGGRVAAFNHERAPMSCLQRLDALKANHWTNINMQWNHQRLQRGLTAHNTLHRELGVTRHFCYICLYKAAC